MKKAQEPGATALARAAQPISQRLDDYWHGLRLQKMEVPALHLLIDDKADVEDKNLTLLDADEMYLQVKASKDSPTFVRATSRSSRYVVEPLGNRPNFGWQFG